MSRPEAPDVCANCQAAIEPQDPVVVLPDAAQSTVHVRCWRVPPDSMTAPRRLAPIETPKPPLLIAPAPRPPRSAPRVAWPGEGDAAPEYERP